MEEFRLFPEQGSDYASRVDLLFLFILAIAVFFTVLIASLIVYFAIRYRRKANQGPMPRPSPMLWLELTWTVIPMGLTMIMFIWGAQLYFHAYRPPADAMDIHVVGKQWMWKVQHPQGRREINELHVPLGRAVRLVMISEDVIHDFYLPEFRIKQDVLPGRYTYAWFKPSRIGESHLFCAQFCGVQHAGMIGTAYVMAPADYDKWLRGLETGVSSMTETESGEQLYRQFGCNSCHGIKAPTLAGLYGSTVRFENGGTAIADESYLREHILTPRTQVVAGYQSIMPTYKGQMNEDQLVQIIAYIKSLRTFKTGHEERK